MIISKIENPSTPDEVCELLLEGDMTIYTAELIHKELKDLLSKFNSFRLQLNKVEEFDTTGVQFLLALQAHAQLAGGSLVLEKPSPGVKDLLELFNVTNSFEVISS